MLRKTCCVDSSGQRLAEDSAARHWDTYLQNTTKSQCEQSTKNGIQACQLGRHQSHSGCTHAHTDREAHRHTQAHTQAHTQMSASPTSKVTRPQDAQLDHTSNQESPKELSWASVLIDLLSLEERGPAVTTDAAVQP